MARKRHAGGNSCDVPGVRNEVDLIALEFLLGVAGDGFRVLHAKCVSAARRSNRQQRRKTCGKGGKNTYRVQDMLATLDEVDGDLFAAELRVLQGS